MSKYFIVVFVVIVLLSGLAPMPAEANHHGGVVFFLIGLVPLIVILGWLRKLSAGSLQKSPSVRWSGSVLATAEAAAPRAADGSEQLVPRMVWCYILVLRLRFLSPM